MILKMENVKTKITSDSQREKVYYLDSRLQDIMDSKNLDFPLLYRDHGINATFEEMSSNISNDFNLGNIKITYTNNVEKSDYYRGEIRFGILATKRRSISTFIHEYAHLLCDIYFYNGHVHHGGEFLNVYRFLLNKYNIVTTEEFNYLIQTEFKGLHVYDDLVESFEIVDNNIVSERYNENKHLHQKNHDDFTWITHPLNSFLQKKIFTEKYHESYITSSVSGKGAIVRIKKFGHEYNSRFSKMSLEELKKICLYSPILMLDCDGFHTTSPNAYYSIPGFYYYDMNEYKTGHYIRRHLERDENVTVIKNKLTDVAKYDRSKKRKPIRAKSINEFNYFDEQIKRRFKELTTEPEKEIINE